MASLQTFGCQLPVTDNEATRHVQKEKKKDWSGSETMDSLEQDYVEDCNEADDGYSVLGLQS